MKLVTRHIIIAVIITILAFIAALLLGDEYLNTFIVTVTAAHVLNMLVFGVNLWRQRYNQN